MTREPATKITAEDAYRLLIGSVIDFANTARLVELEITELNSATPAMTSCRGRLGLTAICGGR